MSKVVVIVSDLIFRTKISSCAQTVGLPLEFASSLDEFTRIATDGTPTAVIVDLEQDDMLIKGLIDSAASHEPQPRLIGFCPHVRKEVMEQARTSGFDQVMTRSSFASNLPSILSEFVA